MIYGNLVHIYEPNIYNPGRKLPFPNIEFHICGPGVGYQFCGRCVRRRCGGGKRGERSCLSWGLKWYKIGFLSDSKRQGGIQIEIKNPEESDCPVPVGVCRWAIGRDFSSSHFLSKLYWCYKLGCNVSTGPGNFNTQRWAQKYYVALGAVQYWTMRL